MCLLTQLRYGLLTRLSGGLSSVNGIEQVAAHLTVYSEQKQEIYKIFLKQTFPCVCDVNAMGSLHNALRKKEPKQIGQPHTFTWSTGWQIIIIDWNYLRVY